MQPPQQVDTGLGGPSSQPVVAVTNNGLTQIAFINAGTLYTVGAANVLSPFTAPVAIAGGASNPSLSLSTSARAIWPSRECVHRARAATTSATPRCSSGQWTLSSSALDQNPADDAGAGTARPQVVCAGDGTGIATWGENGHIFTRRVLGITPSTTVLQADPSSFAGRRPRYRPTFPWSARAVTPPTRRSRSTRSWAAAARANLACWSTACMPRALTGSAAPTT